MTDIKMPPPQMGAPALGVAPKPLPSSIRPGGGPDYGPDGPPKLGIKEGKVDSKKD